MYVLSGHLHTYERVCLQASIHSSASADVLSACMSQPGGGEVPETHRKDSLATHVRRREGGH